MKVGIIGLGRMGEGMSRRMMRQGIEVWGYRRNLEKAAEAHTKGYISGFTSEIKYLAEQVKAGGNKGVFQLVVPAENVEDTLDALLPYVILEILLLITAIAILKTVGEGRRLYQNLVSNILIAVLLVVFMVWSVDSVLWLEAEIVRSPIVQKYSMRYRQGSTQQNAPIPNVTQPQQSRVGYIVDHQEQDTL